MLPDDFAIHLAPVTPFEQLDKSEREALIQMKLGDVFLAAMETAGEPARGAQGLTPGGVDGGAAPLAVRIARM